MNLEKDILQVIEEEVSAGEAGLHKRLQNRLVTLGTANNFTSIKEYLHANPFQKRRGRVDVYWESRRANYAIEIDLSLRKKSLQKLISLQAVAQPIWILLSGHPIQLQQQFLQEHDCFGFVHVIGVGMLKERARGSANTNECNETKDLISVDEDGLKDAINQAADWAELEKSILGLGYTAKPKGGGLVFIIDGMSMKASSLGKNFGFNALCTKLGPPPEHLTPSCYTTALGRPVKKAWSAG